MVGTYINTLWQLQIAKDIYRAKPWFWQFQIACMQKSLNIFFYFLGHFCVAVWCIYNWFLKRNLYLEEVPLPWYKAWYFFTISCIFKDSAKKLKVGSSSSHTLIMIAFWLLSFCNEGLQTRTWLPKPIIDILQKKLKRF